MAAPTDVRVEATSITTTHLRWTYTGSALLRVYRSLDDIDYSPIAILGSAITELEDSNLSSETKYWYKLSDDDGATFSEVVTVWTHACAGGSRIGFSLPYFDVIAEEETTNRLNEMARQVEDVLNDIVIRPGECIVCVEDGRVVLTCEEGCRKFIVIVTDDINSVSAPGCDELDADFIIPPGTTREICGFANGEGFSGDECFQDPVSGGDSGRTISTKKRTSSPGYKRQGGWGGGGVAIGGGCTCVPGKDNELTVKSCVTNNSLCRGDDKYIPLKVCGGRGPYTWTKTGEIKLSGSAIGGEKGDSIISPAEAIDPTIYVVPPDNTGGAVAGNAYDKIIGGVGCGHTLGTTHAIGHTGALFGCNDNFLGCTSSPDINDANLVFGDPTCSCAAHEGHPINGSLFFPTVTCERSCDTSIDGGCACAEAHGAAIDRRTAQMIEAGCNPCGVAAIGATITVTDAVGAEVTIEINA